MSDRVCGALFSIPDLRDHIASSKTTEFPEEFELKLTAVKNQGAVGSCVAHALATAAEYFNKVETGKTKKLSTGYIYGNRLLSTHKGRGMYIRDALKTMVKFGDVPLETFTENIEVPEAIEKFDERYDELESAGQNYRFKSYFRLEDANAIKSNLMDKRPVIMSMNWFDDIQIVDGVMKTDCVVTDKTGGHCMIIYGWSKNGWKVQNSWGTSWGNKGKFELPFDVPMKETWGITDELSDVSLDIKMPFSSKIGKLFAKIIHKIISIFYNRKD